ncbi:hypothetical protein LCGC14_1314700 [marine sediment metagenome]|uniref:Uncharacterized protein n=1 Tax=marine sediment metagenome TaxID=412755 RepID=A0A0F9KLU7_9ZZZZ
MSGENVNSELERGSVGLGIRAAKIRLKAANFTDSGTTGSYTWTDALPAGAFYIGAQCIVHTGFLEDTSAVMTIGKSSGEDEFSNGSSVDLFTGGETKVIVEGEDFGEAVTAVDTVYLQITTDSNYTLVYAGSGDVTVKLFYLSTVEEYD